MSRPLAALIAAVASLAVLAGCGATAPSGAAVVNGEAVPTARYDLLVAATQRSVESSGVPVDWNSGPGRDRLREIQAQAIRLAVRDAVIEQLARKRGVRVADADLDRALTALEQVAGGSDQLDERLRMQGLTRAQYRPLLRDTLLDRELRAGDDHYDQHLASALDGAMVEAFVGPCSSEHSYPRCVDER